MADDIFVQESHQRLFLHAEKSPFEIFSYRKVIVDDLSYRKVMANDFFLIEISSLMIFSYKKVVVDHVFTQKSHD